MMIKTTTTIGFKIPDDYEKEQEFKKSNDMSKWRKYETALYTYYTHEEIAVVEGEKNE